MMRTCCVSRRFREASARFMPVALGVGLAALTAAPPALAQNIPIRGVPGARGIALPPEPPPAPPVLMAHPLDRAAWPDDKKVQFAALNMAAIAAEDAANDLDVFKPKRLGVDLALPGNAALLTPADSGVWSRGPGGEYIWRLKLESPGARAMRVNFSKFLLPQGARLVMKGDDPNIPAEVYVNAGPSNTGSFWSMITPGSAVHLEYVAPRTATQAPIIELTQAVHIYRGPFGGALPDGAQPTSPNVEPGILTCHRDVACDEDILDPVIRDAVGVMFFNVPGGGFSTCTGTLLDDADPDSLVGWFLTADHCINNVVSADSLVVFWFYQRNVTFQNGECVGGVVPDLLTLPRSVGSRILALSDVGSGTDVCLLRLNVAPTQGQGYAGWTLDQPIGQVFGIHHPGGSTKKVVYGDVNPAPFPDCLGSFNYIYLDVSLGAFQGGSSGSALFNANNQVVGQLFGYCLPGGPSCIPDRHVDGGYGRFSNSYAELNFSQFLSNTNLDDVFEPNNSVIEAAPLSIGDTDLQLFTNDDYFRFTALADGRATITATYRTRAINLDLALLNEDGTVVIDQAPSPPGIKDVSANVEGGETYIVRVRRTGGTGDAYTLNYDFQFGVIGDANEDGVVDGFDVVYIFQSFGATCANWDPTDCADITGDLIVGYPDLNLVLRSLGYRRDNFDDRGWKREMRNFYRTQIRPIAKERRRLQRFDLMLLENARP